MSRHNAAAAPRLLLLIALFLLLAACSGEDDATGPGDDTATVTPLTPDYWPLGEGESWTYIRRLKTDPEIFSRIGYQDYNLQMIEDVDWGQQTPLDFLYSPYIHLEVDGMVDTPGGQAHVLRGTRSSEPDGSGDPVNQIELWLSYDSQRIRYEGEDAGAAVDSTFWDGETAFDWLRFGELRWRQLLEDYSGEENGMVSFGEALGFPSVEGFGPHRDLDFDTPMTSDGLPSDPENRFWPDSLISVSLVSEVVRVEDVNYNQLFTFNEIDYFPEMADTIFADCKWVVQSFEFEMYLTNQRDPDAGPGESGIPEVFIPERVRYVTVTQPLRVLLLAPDLGPIRIVTYRDVDWMLEPAEITETELRFHSEDFVEIDYLYDSSLLH